MHLARNPGTFDGRKMKDHFISKADMLLWYIGIAYSDIWLIFLILVSVQKGTVFFYLFFIDSVY